MRVLWFVNGALPAVLERHGQINRGSGFWLSSLLEQLRQTRGIQVEVAAADPRFPDEQFEADGVRYIVVGQRSWQPYYTAQKGDLDKCVELVRERKPDLVHIHGSERFFGLMAARKLIDVPSVISLQGFLGPCLAAFGGALSPRQLWRSQRLIELASGRGLFWRYRELAVAARQEREILSGVQAFMGRTEWDHAVLRSHNPTADYYHVGELLRRQFRETCWDLARAERHTVIFTYAGEPRRGVEVILEALRTVRREIPDVRLRLGGEIGNRRGYDRFLRQLIASCPSDAIELMGYLDGDTMAKRLCDSHVFVHPAFVENSPNSLCEAMQAGLPCIASYAGGIPSLVESGRTGLLFPPGDAAMLARAILRIFRDDDLAQRLGRAARAAASERHAPQRVVSDLLDAYSGVLNGPRQGNRKEPAVTAVAS